MCRPSDRLGSLGAGVCVIAATSRPDLLDAALLRPGRLDRLVYCGFPSAKERSEIARALSRNVEMAPDADFPAAAAAASGFTGADLAALLSDAQLAAVHELLDSTTPTKVGFAELIVVERG